MRLIKRIKRKLNRCDCCWKRATEHFVLEPWDEKLGAEIHYHYCYNCALESGFCVGCGGFFAGAERFDFSDHQGWCDDCWDELKWDMGEGEEYGDMDYYDDYAHSFDEKQPQEVSNQD